MVLSEIYTTTKNALPTIVKSSNLACLELQYYGKFNEKSTNKNAKHPLVKEPLSIKKN